MKHTSTMIIDTKGEGRVEIREHQRLRFERGLYGFEDHIEWALIDSRQQPFAWLQSIRETQTAFILINPYLFRPDYVLDIPDDDYASIGTPAEEDIIVFVIVTIPEYSDKITANLQGPLIINRPQRIGIQSISQNPDWSTKHPILEELNTYVDIVPSG